MFAISPVGTSLDTFGTGYIVGTFRFGSTRNPENNSDIMPPDNDSHHDGDIDIVSDNSHLPDGADSVSSDDSSEGVMCGCHTDRCAYGGGSDADETYSDYRICSVQTCQRRVSRR